MPAPLTAAALLASRAAWGDLEWARTHLRAHAGKTVHISLWPFGGVALRVSSEGDWDELALDSPQLADVRLRLSPAMLPTLASDPDKPGAALAGDGEPGFLQSLRDVANVLPLAFEERVSALVGPLVAHAFTSSLRAFARWPGVATGRLAAGTAAYFTEESASLLKRATFASFAVELSDLQARIERLAL